MALFLWLRTCISGAVLVTSSTQSAVSVGASASRLSAFESLTAPQKFSQFQSVYENVSHLQDSADTEGMSQNNGDAKNAPYAIAVRTGIPGNGAQANPSQADAQQISKIPVLLSMQSNALATSTGATATQSNLFEASAAPSPSGQAQPDPPDSAPNLACLVSLAQQLDQPASTVSQSGAALPNRFTSKKLSGSIMSQLQAPASASYRSLHSVSDELTLPMAAVDSQHSSPVTTPALSASATQPEPDSQAVNPPRRSAIVAPEPSRESAELQPNPAAVNSSLDSTIGTTLTSPATAKPPLSPVAANPTRGSAIATPPTSRVTTEAQLGSSAIDFGPQAVRTARPSNFTAAATRNDSVTVATAPTPSMLTNDSVPRSPQSSRREQKLSSDAAQTQVAPSKQTRVTYEPLQAKPGSDTAAVAKTSPSLTVPFVNGDKEQLPSSANQRTKITSANTGIMSHQNAANNPTANVSPSDSIASEAAPETSNESGEAALAAPQVMTATPSLTGNSQSQAAQQPANAAAPLAPPATPRDPQLIAQVSGPAPSARRDESDSATSPGPAALKRPSDKEQPNTEDSPEAPPASEDLAAQALSPQAPAATTNDADQSEPSTEKSTGGSISDAFLAQSLSNVPFAAWNENLAFSLHLQQSSSTTPGPQTTSASASAPSQSSKEANEAQPAPAATVTDAAAVSHRIGQTDLLPDSPSTPMSAAWGEPPATPADLPTSSTAPGTAEPARTDSDLVLHDLQALQAEAPKAGTTTEIQLHLTGNDQSSAAIRLTDRSGEVNVSVHSSDPDLRNSLRSNLSELSAQLNSQGWKDEAAKTAPILPRPEGRQDSAPNGRNSSNQQQQSANPERQSQRDRRSTNEDWADAIEEYVSTSNTTPGGKN